MLQRSETTSRSCPTRGMFDYIETTWVLPSDDEMPAIS